MEPAHQVERRECVNDGGGSHGQRGGRAEGLRRLWGENYEDVDDEDSGGNIGGGDGTVSAVIGVTGEKVMMMISMVVVVVLVTNLTEVSKLKYCLKGGGKMSVLMLRWRF